MINVTMSPFLHIYFVNFMREKPSKQIQIKPFIYVKGKYSSNCANEYKNNNNNDTWHFPPE